MSYGNDNPSEPRIPSGFRLVYTRDQIAEAVSRLAREITTRLGTVRDSDAMGVPVLRGSLFFFADLAREIPHSIDVYPVRAVGYEGNGKSAEKVFLDVSDLNVTGKDVLLIDDICDTGRTLDEAKSAVLGKGARSVLTVCLVQRILGKETFIPDLVGFEYRGTEWLVGYGMDDCDRHRNLPDIYVMNPRT